MRFTKVLLATMFAGALATPAFAQGTAAPAKAPAAKKEAKADAKAAVKPANAEHKAFDMASTASTKWTAGIKLTADEKTKVAAIKKKFAADLAAMKKDHMAAEKAGKEDDSGIKAKVQALVDQEKAEIRGTLTADQQAKFDANGAKK